MRRAVALSVAFAILMTLTAVVGGTLNAGAVASVTEFSRKISASPRAITVGPDGNLWFTERVGATSQIGRITTLGKVREFAMPSDTEGITVGPDGKLWVTENAGNDILRVTKSGVVTPFTLATCCFEGITAGPDKRLWFIHGSDGGGDVGRISTGGKSKEFNTPGYSSSPFSITAGPDGNLWVADSGDSAILRITTAGVVTGSFSTAGIPQGITAGPDGNLWFTDGTADEIGSITTSGVVNEFPIPTAGSAPLAITSGPDGALWFTERLGNQIGRITTDGVVSEIPVPTANSGPSGITAGPDGNIWFTEANSEKIGRVNLI